jgi:hypothetical protein
VIVQDASEARLDGQVDVEEKVPLPPAVVAEVVLVIESVPVPEFVNWRACEDMLPTRTGWIRT